MKTNDASRIEGEKRGHACKKKNNETKQQHQQRGGRVGKIALE